MAIPEEVVARARKLDASAMEALLAAVYPSVHRMSHALTGRPGAAKQVVHDVMRRSLRVMPKWRLGSAPENWFYHHTLLSARAASTRPPDPKQDLLVTHAGTPGMAAAPAAGGQYVAFVRALRNLPAQQAESFILHHGEKLNSRLLGVAMDCSMEAAGKHLEAARSALAAVAGGDLGSLASSLARAYAALTPTDAAVAPAARRYVVRGLRPRKIKRVLTLLVLLALAAIGYLLWRNREQWIALLSRGP